MALCNRQEPAKEAHRDRERERERRTTRARLTDGLTGWIAEVAGCCWADRNAQKHWADTNMPFREAHSISNDCPTPLLLPLCSLSLPGPPCSSALWLLSCFLFLFFKSGVHKIQIYATLPREVSAGHTAEQKRQILNTLNKDNVRNVTELLSLSLPR